MIKCLSNKNPNSDEFYKHITIGKDYEILEKVPGGQVGICNNENQPLNYPAKCFDIKSDKKGNAHTCEICAKKYIGNVCWCQK